MHTRRAFLADMGMGFVGLALGAMLHRDGIARADDPTGWTPPDGRPHHTPRAKRVIWLMMRGGVSHLESFDPKPAIDRYAGKTMGESPYRSMVFDSPHLKNVREQVANNIIDKQKARIYPAQVGFHKGGQSGIAVSDWWPHLRGCVNDIAVIRSMFTTDNNHGAQLEFLTGRHLLDGCYPTLGAVGALRPGVPERRPAPVHLDGSRPRVAVHGGRGCQLPRPRARGGDPQGRPERPASVRPPRRAGRPVRGRDQGRAPRPVERDRGARVSRRREAARPHPVVRAGLPDADGRAGPAAADR